MSLKDIGEVFDSKILSDNKGHPYTWDPRYCRIKAQPILEEEQQRKADLTRINVQKPGIRSRNVVILGISHKNVHIVTFPSIQNQTTSLVWVNCWQIIQY